MPRDSNTKKRSSDSTIESSTSSNQSSESYNLVEERTKDKAPNYRAIRKSLTESRKFHDRDKLQDHLGSNKSLQSLLRHAFADCDHFEHRLIDTLWRHQKTGKYEQHIKDMFSELEVWVDLANYKLQALTVLKKYDKPSGDSVRTIFKDGRLEEITAQATPYNRHVIHALKNAIRDGDKERVTQVFSDINTLCTLSALEDKILADFDEGIRSKHTIEDITGSRDDANWPDGTDFTNMLRAAYSEGKERFAKDLKKALKQAIEKRDAKSIRVILNHLGAELISSSDNRKKQEHNSRHERHPREENKYRNHTNNHNRETNKSSQSRHTPSYSQIARENNRNPVIVGTGRSGGSEVQFSLLKFYNR